MPDESKTRTIQVQIAPHLQSEEGAARFNAAVEARNQADYQCFMVLRDLADQHLLSPEGFYQLFKTHTDTDKERRELSIYQAEEVERVLKLRKDADQEFGDALRNIPKRTS